MVNDKNQNQRALAFVFDRTNVCRALVIFFQNQTRAYNFYGTDCMN